MAEDDFRGRAEEHRHDAAALVAGAAGEAWVLFAVHAHDLIAEAPAKHGGAALHVVEQPAHVDAAFPQQAIGEPDLPVELGNGRPQRVAGADHVLDETGPAQERKIAIRRAWRYLQPFGHVAGTDGWSLR